VAAVSIGRRYQNPLAELVKIPPKSLGLGMYQHDLSEKDLDDKLAATSVDAVAEVGVDVNACSIEILCKVPSMTKSLCEKVVKARPLQSRSDLLNVPGLGPKTFENCAAFIRVHQGPEQLDATLVHPESYELARWLLKKLKWKLGKPESVGTLPPREAQQSQCDDMTMEAAKRFKCSTERVLTVTDHLLFSITSPDPRLRQVDRSADTEIGSPKGCSALPHSIMSPEALKKACPVRNISATIRNVVDFGAFVDFGGENDGLLHRSKLGPVPLGSFLVGQEIGIDILGVSKSDKVSIGLTGLNLSADDLDAKRPILSKTKAPTAKRQRHK